MEKIKLVVVLGMHRSGTSLITCGLQTLGVDLGDNLMPPADCNAKGFFEDLDINKLNMDMLTALYGGDDWWRAELLSAQQVNHLYEKGFYSTAHQLLIKKTTTTGVYGFKDPRMAKLLPFWTGVFGNGCYDVKYIIAIRNPMSVVQSLQNRDKLDETHSYLMWLGYTLQSMMSTNLSSRIIVDYDLLIQNPEQQLTRVASAFGLPIESDIIKDYSNKFIAKSMRHSLYQTADLYLDNKCPRTVCEVYDTLLSIATDRLTIFAPQIEENVSMWLKETNTISVFMQSSDRLVSINNEANQELAICNEKIPPLNQEIANCNEKITSLNQEIVNVYQSKSYRITKPARIMARFIRKMFL